MRLEQRIDAFVEATYRRLGPRYVPVLFLVALAQASAAGLVMVPVLLLYYPDVGPEDILLSIAGLFGVGVIVVKLVLLPEWKRLVAPAAAWIADPHPDRVEPAAACMRGLSLRLAGAAFVRGFVPIALGAVLWHSLVLRFSPLELVWLVVAGLLVLVWPMLSNLHLAEVAMRPIRRHLAAAAPEVDVGLASIETPIRVRLLIGIFTIAALTGVAVAVVATVGDRALLDLTRLILVALAVTVTGSGILVVLLVRTFTGPIDDLMAATRAVATGELSGHVPVTSDDELGALAASFNVMLRSLEDVSVENEQLLTQVRESRARIVAASDAERRRIERNIHDGVQQQLIALALQLELLRAKARAGPEITAGLEDALDRLRDTHGELRELAQGLHPSVLSSDGLPSALEQLAERSNVPVTVQADDGRYDETVEAAAYFVASEALANVAKYAQASSVAIQLEQRDGRVVLEVADDGIGGAHMGEGSGLTGLADRVEAVGGSLAVDSPPGAGTTIRAILPASGTGVLT